MPGSRADLTRGHDESILHVVRLQRPGRFLDRLLPHLSIVGVDAVSQFLGLMYDLVGIEPEQLAYIGRHVGVGRLAIAMIDALINAPRNVVSNSAQPFLVLMQSAFGPFALGDLVRKPLNAWNPSKQTYSQDNEPPEETNGLLQKGLDFSVTDYDEPVEAREIVGDIKEASEQQKHKSRYNKIPAPSGQLEPATSFVLQIDDYPKQNHGTEALKSYVYNGLSRFNLDWVSLEWAHMHNAP